MELPQDVTDEFFLLRGYLGPAITLLRGEESQAACAERAGVSIRTWSKWENGRIPRENYLPRLLNGLACNQPHLAMTVWQIMTDHLADKGLVDKRLQLSEGRCAVFKPTLWRWRPLSAWS